MQIMQAQIMVVFKSDLFGYKFILLLTSGGHIDVSLIVSQTCKRSLSSLFITSLYVIKCFFNK